MVGVRGTGTPGATFRAVCPEATARGALASNRSLSRIARSASTSADSSSIAENRRYEESGFSASRPIISDSRSSRPGAGSLM